MIVAVPFQLGEQGMCSSNVIDARSPISINLGVIPLQEVLTIAAASTRARWLGSTSNALNLDVQRDAFGIRVSSVRSWMRDCGDGDQQGRQSCGTEAGPWRVAGALALTLTIGGAQAADDSKYPDWRGQWSRFAVSGLPASLRTTRPSRGDAGQQAPLTPEYQAILEASIADQAQGGLGNFPHHQPAAPPACHT